LSRFALSGKSFDLRLGHSFTPSKVLF